MTDSIEAVSTDAPTAAENGAAPDINWSMSAALENVPRGDSELAEVTSLAGAVTAWQALEPTQKAQAVLTVERELMIGGETVTSLSGDAIGELAALLPDTSEPNWGPAP